MTFLLAVVTIAVELVLVALIVAVVTFSLLLLSVATITCFVANLATLIAPALKPPAYRAVLLSSWVVISLNTIHLLVFQVQVMSDLLDCHWIYT
jgi:hypothetical protein